MLAPKYEEVPQEPPKADASENKKIITLDPKAISGIRLAEYMLPRAVCPDWMIPLADKFITASLNGTLTYDFLRTSIMDELLLGDISPLEKVEGALYFTQEIKLSLMNGESDSVATFLSAEISKWLDYYIPLLETGWYEGNRNLHAEALLHVLNSHFSRRKTLDEVSLVGCASELWGYIGDEDLTPNNRIAILTSLSWLHVTNNRILDHLIVSTEVMHYPSEMRSMLCELAELDPTDIPIFKPRSYLNATINRLKDRMDADTKSNPNAQLGGLQALVEDLEDKPYQASFELTRINLLRKFRSNILNTISNLLILGENLDDMAGLFAEMVDHYGDGIHRIIQDIKDEIRLYKPAGAEYIVRKLQLAFEVAYYGTVISREI